MTRRETPFATHGELIVVSARVTGPRRTMTMPLVLDTGAAYTTITPKVAETVGYSERDGLRRTRVRDAEFAARVNGQWHTLVTRGLFRRHGREDR